MKNYVQPSKTITLTAPYAVTSGDGLLVGSIFGVAAGTAALGEAVEATLVGVYDLKKVASQAWAPGDRIYWDNTASTPAQRRCCRPIGLRPFAAPVPSEEIRI